MSMLLNYHISHFVHCKKDLSRTYFLLTGTGKGLNKNELISERLEEVMKYKLNITKDCFDTFQYNEPEEKKDNHVFIGIGTLRQIPLKSIHNLHNLILINSKVTNPLIQ